MEIQCIDGILNTMWVSSTWNIWRLSTLSRYFFLPFYYYHFSNFCLFQSQSSILWLTMLLFGDDKFDSWIVAMLFFVTKNFSFCSFGEKKKLKIWIFKKKNIPPSRPFPSADRNKQIWESHDVSISFDAANINLNINFMIYDKCT